MPLVIDRTIDGFQSFSRLISLVRRAKDSAVIWNLLEEYFTGVLSFFGEQHAALQAGLSLSHLIQHGSAGEAPAAAR